MLPWLPRLRDVALVAVVTGACDSPVVEPVPSFELTGRYQGVIHATTGGDDLDGFPSEDGLDDSADEAELDASVVLVVELQDGNVSGTYGIRGTVAYPGTRIGIAGNGAFTGTVTGSDKLTLGIVVRTPICSEYEGRFVGRFDPTSGLLRLSGAVDIFEDGCRVLVQFDAVLLLYRTSASVQAVQSAGLG